MTVVCTIDATGITVPTYDAVLAELKTSYRNIYGTDVYLEEDSQDGQWLAIVAAAINDANAMAAAVYNAFSPSTAQGNGLSRVVKINGISRRLPTYSSVDLLIGGTAGTVISGGYARGADDAIWYLPDTVTVPTSGQIVVTATAAEIGSVTAPAGTITTIGTPTRGWQTVTNPVAATAGQPVETDSALRRRQAVSTRIPSSTQLEGLIGAVYSLAGVVEVNGKENAGSATDSNGIPGHAFSLVVDGGDAAEIAATIHAERGVGVLSYGTTSETVTDTYGIPHVISFMRPVSVPIVVRITLRALNGYSTNIGTKIKQALADSINALAIGSTVFCTRLYVPANLSGSVDSMTYDITELTISRDGALTYAQSIALAYYEVATCSTDDIVIAVDT